MSWNAISDEFLEVQIPQHVLMYDWDPYRCPVSSARSGQKFGGKKNNNNNKNMKR